jgi:hypothetical protein
VSGFDARLLVWVKPRKTQHEQIFLAVPPIADILSGLRFGFVNLQQARPLFHNRSLCASNPPKASFRRHSRLKYFYHQDWCPQEQAIWSAKQGISDGKTNAAYFSASARPQKVNTSRGKLERGA